MATAKKQGSGMRDADPFRLRWHIHVDGKTYGPYSGYQIRPLVEKRQVLETDLVYSEGASGSTWQQISNDPILGTLFKNPKERRSLIPSVEATPTRRKLLFASGALMLILGWIAWPYYAVYDLAIALREGDASTLENRVEWDSVRQGLRGDLNAMFLRTINSNGKPDTSSGSAIGAGLAVMLGPVVVDRMVDAYVTPQAVAATNHGASERSSSDAENVPPRPVAAIQSARQFRWDQIKYAFFSGGPFTFKVEFTPDHDPPLRHPVELRIQWNGTWKLTRIILPSDVSDIVSGVGKAQPDPASLLASTSPTRSTDEPVSPAVAPKVQPPLEKTEMSWHVEESKSPIDDSAQAMGILLADGSTQMAATALTLRCKEKETEVLFGKQFTFFGSTAPAKVLVRVNDGKAMETQWSPSTNGQYLFAPNAVQFIRALPDEGKLFIRAKGYNGAPVDGAFTLGKVSELRNRIASACRWPDATPLAIAR